MSAELANVPVRSVDGNLVTDDEGRLRAAVSDGSTTVADSDGEGVILTFDSSNSDEYEAILVPFAAVRRSSVGEVRELAAGLVAAATQRPSEHAEFAVVEVHDLAMITVVGVRYWSGVGVAIFDPERLDDGATVLIEEDALTLADALYGAQERYERLAS